MSSTTSEPKDYFKFQLKQESEKYRICHPSPVTRGADLLLELETFLDKNWLIPVDKGFLVSNIPYFEGLFNTDDFWRETKNGDKIEGVAKITFIRPGEVKKQTILKFLEMLHAQAIYDESDFKYQTINFITNENVLEFIELSEFWMVEHIKKEAIDFVSYNINGEMMIRALKYENPFVRKTIEPICQTFFKSTEARAIQGDKFNQQLDEIRDKVYSSIDEAVNDITWARNINRNTSREMNQNKRNNDVKNQENYLHNALKIMGQLDKDLGQLHFLSPKNSF